MKKFTVLLTVMLFIFGCSSSNKLVSNEHDFSITFPCEYEDAGKGTYGCMGDNYTYSVVFKKSPNKNLDNLKKEYEEKIKFGEEENETTKKIISDRKTKDTFNEKEFKLKKFDLKEKSISGYKAVEYTEDVYRADDLVEKTKLLSIYKDDGEIFVKCILSVDMTNTNSLEEAGKQMSEKMKNFFDSMRLAKKAN